MSSFRGEKTTKNPQTLKNHVLKPPEADLLLRFISPLEKLNKKGKKPPPNFHLIFVLIFLVRATQLIEQMNINKSLKYIVGLQLSISSDNFCQ